MNVGPMGLLASVAASPLAQRAADNDRTASAVTSQQRDTKSSELAQKAAGIGEPDGDEHSISDRDADGRREWEFQPPAQEDAPTDANGEVQQPAIRHSIDITATSGGQLDLTV